MNPQRNPLPYLDSLKAMVDERVTTLVNTLASPDLRDAVLYASQGGKRVRPLIVMLACGAVGGDERDALDAGVAIELLHTASLVHDDIMDRSELRRGKPTLHTRFDLPTAILVGDTMVALAFKTAAKIPGGRRNHIMQLISAAFLDLCEGQHDDLSFGRRDLVSRELHESMVEKKTARLLEIAAGIGAAIGTTDEYPVECLRCFGKHVGLAFQAVDDLLDETGDQRVTGKPAGGDRKNGKQTFLTIAYPDVDSAAMISNIVEHHTTEACMALGGLPANPALECLLELARSLSDRVS
jgi:geranylgeranyl pyrophosphate synthase